MNKVFDNEARVESESLEAVFRQSSCIETNAPASSTIAGKNAGTFVAVFVEMSVQLKR